MPIMEPKPLDYATPKPRKRKWWALLIGGVLVLAMIGGAVWETCAYFYRATWMLDKEPRKS